MSFRIPSMSTVANVVGRLRNRKPQVITFPPGVRTVSKAVVASAIVVAAAILKKKKSCSDIDSK